MKFWTFFVLGTALGLSGCFQQLRPELGQSCDPNATDTCGDGYQCVYVESLDAGRCFPASQSDEIADAFAQEICEQSCEAGFTVDGDCECVDIDECATNNGGCDQNCENTEGDYGCDCNSGYELNEDGFSCDELSECPPCQENASCDTATLTCECHQPGYEEQGELCVDIDECATNNGGCETTCTNTPGGFECSCDDGYALNSDGRSCDDVDECDDNNGGCETTCTNTPGDFECSCDDGYELNADGRSCDDVNECEANNGGCEITCTNTAGSFECSCPVGFQLQINDEGCEDVNECEANNGGCETTCTNTNGGFECSCDDGYALDTDGLACKDVDECEETPNPCGHQACINNPGAPATCICPDGTYDDGVACEDVSEAFSSCPTEPINSSEQAFSMGALPNDTDGTALGSYGWTYWCQVETPDGNIGAPAPCSDDGTFSDMFRLSELQSSGALPQGDLSDGNYRITVTYSNEAGMGGDGASCDFTLDTTGPAITVTNDMDSNNEKFLVGDLMNMEDPLTFNSDSVLTAADGQLVGIDDDCDELPASTTYLRCIEPMHQLCLFDDTRNDNTPLSQNGTFKLCLQVTDEAGNTTKVEHLVYADVCYRHNCQSEDQACVYSTSGAAQCENTTNLEISFTHTALPDPVSDTTTLTFSANRTLPVTFECAVQLPDTLCSMVASTAYEGCNDAEGNTGSFDLDFTPGELSLQQGPNRLCVKATSSDGTEVTAFQEFNASLCPATVCAQGEACYATTGASQGTCYRLADFALATGLTPEPGILEEDQTITTVPGSFRLMTRMNPALLTALPSPERPVCNANLHVNENLVLLGDAHDISQRIHDFLWEDASLFLDGDPTNPPFSASFEILSSTPVEGSTPFDAWETFTIYPKKLVAFTGSLTLSCSYTVYEGTEPEVLQASQTFVFLQQPDAGDACATDVQCSGGMLSSNISGETNQFYHHENNETWEDISTKWESLDCVGGFDSGSTGRDCPIYTLADEEKQCVFDGDNTHRKLNICNPLPAHQRKILEIENYPDSLTTEFYCHKAHQYVAPTAQGFECHEDEQYACVNAIDREPQPRCLSYPVDDDGNWDLSKRPTSDKNNGIYVPCTSDGQCASGYCIENDDEESFCMSSGRDGDGAGVWLDDHTEPLMSNGCSWPLAEVTFTNANQESGELVTHHILCGRSCTASTAEQLCLEGNGACTSQGDDNIEICTMPNWDCFLDEEYLYFGGSPHGHTSFYAQGGHFSNFQPSTWAFSTEVLFEADFFDHNKTVRLFSNTEGNSFIEATYVTANNTILWTNTVDPVSGDKCFEGTLITDASQGFTDFEFEKALNEDTSATELTLHINDDEFPLQANCFFNPFTGPAGGNGFILGHKNPTATDNHTGFWLNETNLTIEEDDHLTLFDISEFGEGCEASSFAGFDFIDRDGETLDLDHSYLQLGISPVCDEDPEGAHTHNQHAISFTESASEFIIQFDEALAGDFEDTAGEITASFWFKLPHFSGDPPSSERSVLQVASLDGTISGGLELTYEVTPGQTEDMPDQLLFGLLLRGDNPSVPICESFVFAEDLHQPIHLVFAVDSQDSWGQPDPVLDFFANGTQAQSGCTAAAWETWGLANINYNNGWQKWTFGADTGHQFFLEDVVIYDEKISLGPDSDLRAERLETLQNSPYWTYHQEENNDDGSGEPHCYVQNPQAYFSFDQLSNAEEFVESGSVENEITGLSATAQVSRVMVTPSFRQERDQKDFLFSGPFSALAVENFSGNASDPDQLAVVAQFEGAVFTHQDLGLPSAPIGTNGHAQLFVGLMNLDAYKIEDYFYLSCHDNLSPAVISFKQMLTHEDKIFVLFSATNNALSSDCAIHHAGESTTFARSAASWLGEYTYLLTAHKEAGGFIFEDSFIFDGSKAPQAATPFKINDEVVLAYAYDSDNGTDPVAKIEIVKGFFQGEGSSLTSEILSITGGGNVGEITNANLAALTANAQHLFLGVQDQPPGSTPKVYRFAHHDNQWYRSPALSVRINTCTQDCPGTLLDLQANGDTLAASVKSPNNEFFLSVGASGQGAYNDTMFTYVFQNHPGFTENVVSQPGLFNGGFDATTRFRLAPMSKHFQIVTAGYVGGNILYRYSEFAIKNSADGSSITEIKNNTTFEVYDQSASITMGMCFLGEGEEQSGTAISLRMGNSDSPESELIKITDEAEDEFGTLNMPAGHSRNQAGFIRTTPPSH